MKKLILVLVIITSFNSFAKEGGTVGNGGNDLALEFLSLANKVVVDANSKYSFLITPNIESILAGVKIVVSKKPLYVDTPSGSQGVAAVNKKNPNTIVINGSGNNDSWQNIRNENIKMALVLHELLGLAGVESTGDYHVSSRYLKLKESGSDDLSSVENVTLSEKCLQTIKSRLQIALNVLYPEMGEINFDEQVLADSARYFGNDNLTSSPLYKTHTGKFFIEDGYLSGDGAAVIIRPNQTSCEIVQLDLKFED